MLPPEEGDWKLEGLTLDSESAEKKARRIPVISVLYLCDCVCFHF